MLYRAYICRLRKAEDCVPELRHSVSEGLNCRKQRRSWSCAVVQIHVSKGASAKDSKQYTGQMLERFASSIMERVPVEIWQIILLKAMEMDEAPIFETSCTSYTFLYFLNQQALSR